MASFAGAAPIVLAAVAVARPPPLGVAAVVVDEAHLLASGHGAADGLGVRAGSARHVHLVTLLVTAHHEPGDVAALGKAVAWRFQRDTVRRRHYQ